MRFSSKAFALSILLLTVPLVPPSFSTPAPFAEAKRLEAQVLSLIRARRFTEALPLAKHALEIREKALGPGHPHVATGLNNLAELYHAQGRNNNADPLYWRSPAILEKKLGPVHPNIVKTLNNMAGVYEKLGRKKEAAGFLERAEAMKKRLAGR
jgi:tetratricopeptide (TPR) repeat protein